jgi:flagellin
MNAQQLSNQTQKEIGSSLEKLASGHSINHASDDAAGLAIADKLRTQAASLNQGIKNANSGVAMIQMADKAMDEQSNILNTVKTKLIQAADSSVTQLGRDAINNDIQKLLSQLDNIASQTDYNGQKLLEGSSGSLTTNTTSLTASNTAGVADVAAVAQSYTKEVTSPSADGNSTITVGGQTITVTLAASDTDSQTATKIANAFNGTASGQGGQLTNMSGITAVANNGVITFTSDTAGTAISDITIDNSVFNNISNTTNVQGVTGSAEKDEITLDNTYDVGDVLTFSSGNETLSYTVKDGITTGAKIAADLASEINNTNNTEFNKFQATTSGSKLTLTSLTNGVDTMSAASIAVVNTATNNASSNNLSFQVGEKATETITLTGTNTNTSGLGLATLAAISTTTSGSLDINKAKSNQALIDTALDKVNTARGNLGSTQLQLESAVRNQQVTVVSLNQAESVIRDTDYAAESANFNKLNIISQAGMYAISQANAAQQNVMKLLQ